MRDVDLRFYVTGLRLGQLRSLGELLPTNLLNDRRTVFIPKAMSRLISAWEELATLNLNEKRLASGRAILTSIDKAIDILPFTLENLEQLNDVVSQLRECALGMAQAPERRWFDLGFYLAQGMDTSIWTINAEALRRVEISKSNWRFDERNEVDRLASELGEDINGLFPDPATINNGQVLGQAPFPPPPLWGWVCMEAGRNQLAEKVETIALATTTTDAAVVTEARVDLEQRTLHCTKGEFQLGDEEVAILLYELVNARGGWVSDPEIARRHNLPGKLRGKRVLAKAPREVRRMVESKKGAGRRFVIQSGGDSDTQGGPRRKRAG